MQVGQRVVCVDDAPRKRFPILPGWPTKGQVYTVRGTRMLLSGVGVYLEEIHNEPMILGGHLVEPSFWHGRFRPVRETNIDCFLAILESLDVKKHQPQKEDA